MSLISLKNVQKLKNNRAFFFRNANNVYEIEIDFENGEINRYGIKKIGIEHEALTDAPV